jgi:hypothetical protein
MTSDDAETEGFVVGDEGAEEGVFLVEIKGDTGSDVVGFVGVRGVWGGWLLVVVVEKGF